ncbi:MAG: EAL domain-containing protein [Cellulomonadaceae bacterium]|nr:EAL domain-containing protein [Cellulomonadaceae bacterium]
MITATPDQQPAAVGRPPHRRALAGARRALARARTTWLADSAAMTVGSTAFAIALIVLETALATAILFQVGGAPHPVVHLYYVPITSAAIRFGWRGAVAAAVPAGLLAGPVAPHLLLAAGPIDSSWVVRAVMYVGVGLLVAMLSGQAKHSVATTLRDAISSRALLRALERGDLEAHYQPIVELRTGRVVGIEALCRWRDPAGSWVPPAAFIPLAERTGVILPLGRFMLRQATAQCAVWSAQGLGHLVVNVNVSAEQLSDPAFLADVSTALVTSGLRPEQLCLEITESTIIRNPEAALATVTAAHQMGILIALDDFGTGHSSLAYLQDFPIDVIKIDQSFVARVDCDPKCSTLVLAIIEMSHALGATTVAEGIERPSQYASLHVLGCEDGQGYHLGRPGPAPATGQGWLQQAETDPEVLARLAAAWPDAARAYDPDTVDRGSAPLPTRDTTDGSR